MNYPFFSITFDGLVTVKRKLDRECSQIHELVIMAVDAGKFEGAFF